MPDQSPHEADKPAARSKAPTTRPTWPHLTRLWRVADGTLLATLTGHTDQVTSVAFAPDGQTLASGSWDGTVRLWGVPP